MARRKIKEPPPPPPPPPPPKERIYWTEGEQEELLARAANILFKNPGRSIRSAFLGAQESFLPAARRRNIQTLNSIPWYRDGIAAAVEKVKSSVVEEQQFKIIEQVEVVWQKLADTKTEDLLEELFSRMLKAGGHSVVAILCQQIAACVRAELPHVIEQMKKPAVPEIQRKRKVVVVGLLPEQGQHVEKELGDCFTFWFWKDASSDQLKLRAMNADRTFVMKRFVSHNYQNMLRSVGASFTIVPGGTSELIAVLEKYYVEVSDGIALATAAAG